MSTNTISYWDSPESILLFQPQDGESVQGCLRRRTVMLLEASRNDDALILLTSDLEDISDLSVKQTEQLRVRCVYLAKVYETAIQCMNGMCWVDCCIIAISKFDDSGIDYITKMLDKS